MNLNFEVGFDMELLKMVKHLDRSWYEIGVSYGSCFLYLIYCCGSEYCSSWWYCCLGDIAKEFIVYRNPWGRLSFEELLPATSSPFEFMWSGIIGVG